MKLLLDIYLLIFISELSIQKNSFVNISKNYLVAAPPPHNLEWDSKFICEHIKFIHIHVSRMMFDKLGDR